MFRAPQLPRTLEASLRDLHDEKSRVREGAVRDIVHHAEASREEVVLALREALRDGAAEVRASAATALADVEAREALPSLLSAADDMDGSVRQMAVAALGELGEAEALPRIEQALSDERPEVRFQAVIAFPRLARDVEVSVLAIEAATRDTDAFVAHIALRMSEEIGEEAGEVDVRLLRRARALLGHDSPMVRVAAAILLARGGERAGREVLAATACADIVTRDGEDEAAAIELCGELALKEALPGLERRAFGRTFSLQRDRFAWHARVALARMGHERATREILKELESWDADRRTLAVAAAGRARLHSAKSTIVAMRDAGRADRHAADEALRALAEALLDDSEDKAREEEAS